jgi:hypothetical protein
MSDSCCSTTGSQQKFTKTICPQCATEGKKVQRITLGALLKPEARKRMPPGEAFLFCPSANCPAVYFHEGKPLFGLEDLTVRIGQKAAEEPKPICYCFGYTEKAIMEDVLKNQGKTNIPAEITAQVKSGNCFCEVTNPQGSCCLGNISQAVKKGVALYNQGKKSA